MSDTEVSIGDQLDTLAGLDSSQRREVAEQLARRMKQNGETAATICKTLGIGRTTLYRYLDATD